MDWKRIAIYTVVLFVGVSLQGFLFGLVANAIASVETSPPRQQMIWLANVTQLGVVAVILFFFVKKLTKNVVLNVSAIALVHLLILTSIHFSIGGFEHVVRMQRVYVVFILALVLGSALGLYLGNDSRNKNLSEDMT